MSRWFLALVLATACGGPKVKEIMPSRPIDDPGGVHKAAVEQQVRAFVDDEVLGPTVIGLYDGGKREIYGFGTPRPDGSTLFELGAVTKAYTGLLLADAVQRREVELDGAMAELLPPGVTAPSRDKVAITLRHLALHSSGLPRLPPSLQGSAADPYAKYDDEALYRDLVSTQLETTPGTQVSYSTYGYGVLGFLIGKRAGIGFAKALATRVLGPLELADTHLALAGAPASGKLVKGMTDDLVPTPAWTWQALAGAGGLVSSARDQLHFIEVELDAANGSKGPLRAPMRLTQETQLEATQPQNEGIGWQIDSAGRFWSNGGTAGFRAFLGFDTKTKRGVVILSATATSLVDGLARTMFDILDGTAKPPPKRPSPEQLASYAGAYDLTGTRLAVTVKGKRLYLEGPGEPPHRLVAVSERQFWIEALQSLAVFQHDKDNKVTGIVFQVGANQLVATRLPG